MFRFILFIFVGFCSSYFSGIQQCVHQSREDRGRDARWRGCVKGGFCLMNCFSKAVECQIFFQDELACGIARFMTRARELIPLPLVSSLWLVWQQLFTDLSLSFSRVLWSNSAPPGRRSDKFSSCPRALVQLPGCSKPFYGTHRKSIFMRAMIAISSLDTPG